MSKHTPGPWKVEDNPWGGTPHVRSGRRRLLRLLAEGNEEIAESVANARLIAAAPDLLAALEAVTTHLGELLIDLGPCEDDRDVLDVARAAIAKARGA